MTLLNELDMINLLIYSSGNVEPEPLNYNTNRNGQTAYLLIPFSLFCVSVVYINYEGVPPKDWVG